MSSKKEPLHISGPLHITGRSEFIGDGLRPTTMLNAKLFVSTKAHAEIINLDISAAQNLAGVHAVITYKDIPGQNQVGHPVPDQPLLAENEVVHVGQAIAIVVAENLEIASEACKLIKIEYRELAPLFTIPKAIAAESYFAPERKIERGEVEQAWREADHIIEGEVECGAQEHFYFETQRTWAIPGDDRELTLYAATQSPNDTQAVAAKVLGVAKKDVTVDVKRLGGAFGGKENSPSDLVAAAAALSAYLTKRPVELKLTRLEDMSWTGKRHPFLSRYKIAFTKAGKITGYEVKLYANGGAFTDLSMAILERAMLHAENTYFIPNIRILGYACRTNLPANTAFRGFGAPQGVFAIEYALTKVAHKLQLDPLQIRKDNLYKEKETTPYNQIVHEACQQELLEKLQKTSNYSVLVKECSEFNSKNSYLKRGIGVVPVKFGISFTASFLNQASSLLWIYADGSISLSHGGVEMGQEVNTKVGQVVARELGVDLATIRVESANTKRVANSSPTAASSGSDLNGHAALAAAQELKARLKLVAVHYFKTNFEHDSNPVNIQFRANKVFDSSNSKIAVNFNELASFAYLHQTDLGAHGFYRAPGLHFDRETGVGNPFLYYVYGVCLVQSEVDILTGKNRLLKVYIVHEAAEPLNSDIDREQIYGAFMQGYGWSTMEEILYDDKGNNLAATPSTYKIPAIRDLPEVFEVELVELKREHASVFGSKAVGEPPFLYGEAGYFAIKNALESISAYEQEAELAMPATPEAIVIAAERLL